MSVVRQARRRRSLISCINFKENYEANDIREARCFFGNNS